MQVRVLLEEPMVRAGLAKVTGLTQRGHQGCRAPAQAEPPRQKHSWRCCGQVRQQQLCGCAAAARSSVRRGRSARCQASWAQSHWTLLHTALPVVSIAIAAPVWQHW